MQKPQSRNEAILQSMIDGTEYTDPPQSRIEALLLELKEVIEAGGGEIVVDDEISTTSTHPVQNRVIAANLLPAIAGITPNSSGSMELDREDLNDFTTSGIYNAMNCENAPFNDMALVILGYSMDGYCVQIACDVASGNFKFRNQIDGNWTAWGDNILSTLEAHTAAINELENNTKSIQTATGNPLTIESAESNLVECVAEVECVQEGSGDPSPDNIRPITGQTEVVIEDVGKNLCPYTESGTIKNSGADIANDAYARTPYIEVNEGVEYTFSVNPLQGKSIRISINFFSQKDTYIISELLQTTNSINFVPPAGSNYIRVVLFTTDNASPAISYFENPQLELGSTATTYEPYKGKTYRVEIGQKNKLPMTVEGIKSANTSGTWSGNSYTRNGVTFEVQTDNDGLVTGILVNGTPSKETPLILCANVDGADYNDTILNGYPGGLSNVTLHFGEASSPYREFIDTGNGVTINGLESKVDWRSYIYVNTGTTISNLLIQPMIRTTIDDSEFVPYNPKLPDAIYGGELDVTRGELVVDKAYKTISEISGWADTTSGNVKRYSTSSLRDMEITDIRGLVGLISNKYETISDDRAFADCPLYCIYNNSEGGVYIHDQRYNSLSDFLTAEADTQIVYPLATPYTIQLTPEQIRLLKGTNHLSCNTGDLSIEYYPDNVLGQLKGDIENEYDERVVNLEEKANNALKIKSITTTTGTNQQGVSSSSYDNYVQGDKKLIPLSITAKTPGYEVVDVHYVLDEINRLIYFIPKDLTGSAIPSGRTVSMTIYYFEI